MRSFKKALVSFLVIILCVVTLSAIIIMPYMSSQDRETRKELAGSLDYLVVGASLAQLGFSTEILDTKLGVNSYNLSSILMSMNGRLALLQKELSRNPVNTVVMEISYDALSIDYDKTFNEGDPPIIARLDTAAERLNYLSSYVKTDGWLNVYARMIVFGISSWKDNIRGSGNNTSLYKGFSAWSANDVTLSKKDASTKHDRWPYEVENTRPENLDSLKQMIEMCKERNIRVIIVVTPWSDGFIWEHSDLDDFSSMLGNYCAENNCEYYDLNLDKERYSLYSDKSSFMDTTHLSSSGASTMTERFCSIITEANEGKDVSHWFYDSYETMKMDSPYMVSIE